MSAIPDDDQVYLTRAMPTSAIRYTDAYDREVRQQGNRHVVVKHVRSARRVHWFFHTGVGMLATLVLLSAAIWGIHAWNAHQLDAAYGFPRTWQTDQVVGHDHDSPLHKTHFTFENLDGHIFFVEIPAGDLSKARVYTVVTLLGDTPANWPVTAEFKDVKGDGRLDILIHIQDQTLVYLNNGTGFQPEPTP